MVIVFFFGPLIDCCLNNSRVTMCFETILLYVDLFLTANLLIDNEM